MRIVIKYTYIYLLSLFHPYTHAHAYVYACATPGERGKEVQKPLASHSSSCERRCAAVGMVSKRATRLACVATLKRRPSVEAVVGEDASQGQRGAHGRSATVADESATVADRWG